MTSCAFDFGAGLAGLKREEKASVVVAGGMTWETDMGRCWEKKEATWISGGWERLSQPSMVTAKSGMMGNIPKG